MITKSSASAPCRQQRAPSHLYHWIPAAAGITLLLLVAASPASAAKLTVPLYHATYAVNRNSLHVGNAQFSLVRNTNGTYTYESITRASGLASLLFSDVFTEISYFEVNGGHLQPLLYTYTHSSHARDDQTIRFEWNRGIAESTDGDEHKNLPIKPGIYDRALAQLAISIDMAAERLRDDYRVLDHGEFHNYRMQHAGQAQRRTPAGDYATVKVARKDPKKDRVTTFWLAPKLDYLPVQMQQTEPGKATISLVLTEIHLDSRG